MGWELEWTCMLEMREELVVRRQEGGRGEAKMKDNVRNIREMRQAVELLKEGIDTPRVLVQLHFIKSRSLAEPISADASMAGPTAKP